MGTTQSSFAGVSSLSSSAVTNAPRGTTIGLTLAGKRRDSGQWRRVRPDVGRHQSSFMILRARMLARTQQLAAPVDLQTGCQGWPIGEHGINDALGVGLELGAANLWQFQRELIGPGRAE